MCRYFFHVSGSRAVVDVNGVELADDDAAWGEAVSSCGHLLQGLADHLAEQTEITLRVADEGGRHVATLRFVGRRRQEAALGEVADRVAEQLDATLDWLRDVHGPSADGSHAHELGLAALQGLRDGDSIGRGLVVRREGSG